MTTKSTIIPNATKPFFITNRPPITVVCVNKRENLHVGQRDRFLVPLKLPLKWQGFHNLSRCTTA
jgi:hypothetical protein